MCESSNFVSPCGFSSQSVTAQTKLRCLAACVDINYSISDALSSAHASTQASETVLHRLYCSVLVIIKHTQSSRKHGYRAACRSASLLFGHLVHVHILPA